MNGNIDLKGGIISSSANAEKNNLETGSLTASDIENKSTASAKSNGFVLPNGALNQGKYGIGKTILGNYMNSAEADKSYTGQTKSAISNGTIIIKNNNQQLALTGKNSEQAIADLNRDTQNAHKPVEVINVSSLEKKVNDEVALKQNLFNELIKNADQAYEAMFVSDSPILVIERDENGKVIVDKDTNIPKYRVLTDEEKKHLVRGSDGKIRISDNGIFNDMDYSAKYAYQHAGDVDGPIYFQFFPTTHSFIPEMMVSSYQKMLENEFWGMTKSGDAMIGYAEKYGAQGLEIYAHSRGSMTWYNAMAALDKRGESGVLLNTDVHFYGAAANAQKAANMLNKLSNGNKDSVALQVHKYDIVGVIIGRNPITTFDIPKGYNQAQALTDMFTGYKDKNYSVHSCYGTGQGDCQSVFGSANTVIIKAKGR